MTPRTVIPEDRAINLHTRGLTDSAIALELGFHTASITRWRNNHCLKRNTTSGRKPKHLKTTQVQNR